MRRRNISKILFVTVLVLTNYSDHHYLSVERSSEVDRICVENFLFCARFRFDCKFQITIIYFTCWIHVARTEKMFSISFDLLNYFWLFVLIVPSRPSSASSDEFPQIIFYNLFPLKTISDEIQTCNLWCWNCKVPMESNSDSPRKERDLSWSWKMPPQLS